MDLLARIGLFEVGSTRPKGVEKGSAQQSGIRKGNEKAYNLYRQFLLDIPRMDVFVDGVQSNDNPTCLFMQLWSDFGFSLKYCTQSSLATWFEKGRKEYCKGEDEHLLDGGRQIVEIFTREKLITVKKPFKVVHVGVEPAQISTVHLVITYDSAHNTKRNAWYIEQFADSTTDVKIDWIIVD